jgi:tetratricopeptide (TPR) repeat protein
LKLLIEFFENFVRGCILKTTSLVLFLSISFSISALAQAPVSPGMSVANPQSPDSITRPDSIGDLGMYDYWGGMSGQGRAGGVLLGKLTIEGESLPWDPIPISVLCKGQTLATAQTDVLGRFVIPTGKSFCPASACNQTHAEQLPLEGCTIQAFAAGFGSNSVTITERNLRDDPNVGTITIFRKEGRDLGTAVSDTGRSAPEEASKTFEKARKEYFERKTDRAESDLEAVVKIDPQFADAWFELGNIQQATNRDEARNSYAKALAADPKFVLPYEELAFMDAQEGKWQQVLIDTSHQVQLDPVGTKQTWYYDAMANFELKNFDAAQASALKSVALDPQHTIPTSERLIAVILAKKGDYAGALDHLRKCLAYTAPGPDANLLKKQIAMLQSKTSASK